MSIKVTQTRTRPSNDIAWHNPDLKDRWQAAYSNSDFDESEFIVTATMETVSNDGKTMITTATYKDIESFIRAQKDIVPSELRQLQRQYRQANGIVATMTFVDLETNAEITREEIVTKEAEMRAAGLLSADHEYFAPRS